MPIIIFMFLLLFSCKESLQYFKTSEPVQTSQGLIIEDLKVGSGEKAVNGKKVIVHYTGKLENGKVFDSSLDRNVPFDFILGQGQVIKGWDEGILGMQIGGKRKLTIPPELAYGKEGYGEIIPQNSTLIFEVELLNLETI